MEIPSLFLIVFFLSLAGGVSLVSSDNSLQDKCAPDITKLTECLSYASAKADTPSAACCGSVSGIRQKDAVCLCYIIQQSHSGSSAATSLGLQMDRLIKLPAACKLANASLSDCPKLLNLKPSSPDYGIFTNSTKAMTTPAGQSGASTSSGNSSRCYESIMNKIHFGCLFAVTMISALYFTIL